VTSLAWNRADTRLASASADGTVKLWDLARGKEILSLRGPGTHVTAVAWSPDDTRLACGGSEGTILVRDATPGFAVERSPQLLPLLNRRLATEPTAEDWQMRADIQARRGDWDRAAADARQYLALSEERQRVFVTGWWILGPFPPNLKESYPLEQNPANEEAPALPRWQTIPRDANGLVDFSEWFRGTEPFSAHAQVRVYALDKQPDVLQVGSSGPARFWLNGQLVHERAGDGPAAPAQDGVPVTLEAGWNTVLAQVMPGKDEQVLYLRLSGEPVHPSLSAIERFEQELARRKVQRGSDHPDTRAAVNHLALVYAAVQRYDRQEPLLRTLLVQTRKQSGPRSVQAAGALAGLSANLLRQEKYTDAEPLLRECLAIRAKEMPDDWLTFNTRSMLGGALVGQKKYAEAEPLLLAGYEGMKQREAWMPPHVRQRLIEALERLVEIHDATGKRDEAARWRKVLEAATKR
jgi:hypothetical protein